MVICTNLGYQPSRGRPAIARAAIARPLRVRDRVRGRLGIGIVPSYGAIAMG